MCTDRQSDILADHSDSIPRRELDQILEDLADHGMVDRLVDEYFRAIPDTLTS